MANDSFSVYHDNVLRVSTVTATDVAAGSSSAYLSDDRLSFKFATEGRQSSVLIDQTSVSGAPNFKSWEYFVLVDHNLEGSLMLITAYDGPSQTGGSAALNFQVIPDEDPFIVQNTTGVVRTGDQSFDVMIVSPENTTWNVGEMMLASKFDSPRASVTTVPSSLTPKKNFFDMPNGERLSIKRGGTPRTKQYEVRGMSLAEGDSWVEVYEQNAGSAIVILDDERGAIYPALMDQRLSVVREHDFVNMTLNFTEVVIS